MTDLDAFSMFLLGLLGTGHCLGMCGPLVFAFPGRTGAVTAHILYHLGRIVAYSCIGALLGGISAAIQWGFPENDPAVLGWIAHAQIFFSLAAAGFLAGFALLRLGLLKEPEWMAWVSPERIPGYRHIINTGTSAFLLLQMPAIGFLLGFLPCGLSFAAFARALAVPDPLTGGSMVFCFGIGTLPGLLVFGVGAAQWVGRYRRHSDILSGLLMVWMALDLLTDGLQALLT